MRGLGRKDEPKIGSGKGMETGVDGGGGPVVVNPVTTLPMAAAVDSEAAAGVGLEVGFAAPVGMARDAGGETFGTNGRAIEAAESGVAAEAGTEAKDGAAAKPEEVSALTGKAAEGSTVPAQVDSGLPPKVVADAFAAVKRGLLAGSTDSEVVGAAVPASAGNAKQQGSAVKGMQGKASGLERHPGNADVALGLTQDGLAKVGGAAGAQAGLTGENGRGQHEGKGEVRPAGKPSGEVAETGARDGAAADGRSSEPSQPVLPTTAPVQATAAAMLPLMAAPVEAPRTGGASDRGMVSEPRESTGLGSAGTAGTGSAGGNVGLGLAEAAPLTSVGAARLLKTMAGSELRVGTQSADLGAVTIRTVLGREQMQAHISFENERMGSALSSHLLGGTLEDRLGQSLGVRASVTLSAGTEAGTGQSGRETAHQTSTGQFGGQSGSGNGGGRDGSGRYGAEAAVSGVSHHGRDGVGLSVSRSMQYGGAAAVEGRLDIRV